MHRYVVRRLALALPTLLGLMVLSFTLIVLTPGDPAVELARRRAPSGEATPLDIARAREELRLDRPYPVQLGEWILGLGRADLGRSFSTGRPVSTELADRLPATGQLAVAALMLSVLLALPLGALAALHRNSPLDQLLRIGALLGASLPGFFLAYLLIVVFATTLHLLPVAGRGEPQSVILPTLTLAAGPTAILSRLVRASLLEVLGEDFIRTARARGLREGAIVARHALPNALLGVITIVGSLVGHLLAGAVIVETIFAWPGVGKLAIEAIQQRDYTLIQGIVLFVGTVFIVVNLLVDLSYAVVDPRVRIGAAGAA